MEYKAIRNFNRKGVVIEKNQFVSVNDDEAEALKKYGFIQKRGRKAKKK